MRGPVGLLLIGLVLSSCSAGDELAGRPVSSDAPAPVGPQLPTTVGDNSPLVRTDFSSDAAWRALCTEASTPSEDGFLAGLRFVDDPVWTSAPADQLVAAVPEGSFESVIFVADARTMTQPEHPVLVVDGQDASQSFRVAPSELWSVQNNLSLANMDWAEFADAVDTDGVFRGF